MTDEQLSALTRAATPGPWTAVPLNLAKDKVWAVRAWMVTTHRSAEMEYRAIARVQAPGFIADYVPQELVDADAAHIAAWNPQRALAALAVIEAATMVNGNRRSPHHADQDSAMYELGRALVAWDATP